MAFAEATFRTQFPEFASTTKFTSAMVSFWSTLAAKLVNERRFGDLYDHALSCFVAHNLVIQAGNLASVTGSGLPGLSGAIASKSVGGASVSYDSASSMLPNAGHWNMTSYGRQFVQLGRLVGAGGMHV